MRLHSRFLGAVCWAGLGLLAVLLAGTGRDAAFLLKTEAAVDQATVQAATINSQEPKSVATTAPDGWPLLDNAGRLPTASRTANETFPHNAVAVPNARDERGVLTTPRYAEHERGAQTAIVQHLRARLCIWQT